MQREPQFTVKISSMVPDGQRESLQSVFQHRTAVQQETDRVIEWAVIIVALKVTGAGAGAAASILSLAREINKWRHEARQADVEPDVKFEGVGQPTLDLATATDEQVRNWIAAYATNEEVPEWLATATDEEVRIWISRRLDPQ
jgi:hypothetical protein